MHEELLKQIRVYDEGAVVIKGVHCDSVIIENGYNYAHISKLLGDWSEKTGNDIELQLLGEDVEYCGECNEYVLMENTVAIPEEGYICKECAKRNEDYLDSLINNPNDANNNVLDVDFIKEKGFVLVDEEYDAGLYSHNKNDSPEEILKEYNDKGFDVIFNIVAGNPFETLWNIYIRKA